MLANITFLFVDQSSPDVCLGTREESLSIIFLSDFGNLESFRAYSRSKPKVVKIAPNFGRFLPSQILGGAPSNNYKTYPCYHLCLALRRLEKLLEDTPTSPEVIGANTQNFKANFKANFKFSRLNFLGTPVPVLVCASKV